MKFLILTQYYPPEVGASQTRLAAFAQQLKEDGHSVEIVTAFPNYPKGAVFPEYRRRWLLSETYEGIRVHRTWIYASVGAGVKRILNYLSFSVTSFIGLLKSHRPDWIFVESPPPILALTALLAGKLWSVPVIVNVADLWPDSVSALGLMKQGKALKLLSSLEEFVYKHASIVNAVTEGIRSRLAEDKGVELARITFLPNGVDTNSYLPLAPDESLRRALGISASHIVLYIGTHGYAHGLEYVLDCARILGSEDIQFVFVGDGSEKSSLVQRARQLHLNNITFCDSVPARQVPRYLSLADCALVPQRKVELFRGNRPAKTLAIMACAKPVVFSGEGEGASLVRRARAGLVVSPENPKAMAVAIKRLTEDCSLREELGRNGRKYVCANFKWSDLISEWLDQLDLSAPSLTGFIRHLDDGNRSNLQETENAGRPFGSSD